MLLNYQKFEYKYSGSLLTIIDNIQILNNNVCFVSKLKKKKVLALLFPYSKLSQGLTSFKTISKIIKILIKPEYYFEPE